MDRALDPEMLRLALGERQNLPTPQELAELLTQAELGLLLHRPQLTDQLIHTGWYLHAVASSRYALRQYGISRQRAAYRVAGHIFDLQLQQPDLSQIDRLKYCFAAQIAFMRSELDPNSLAVYSREASQLQGDPDFLTGSQDLALRCSVALLGMNLAQVFRHTNPARREFLRLATDWEVESVFVTPFAPSAAVILATRSLAGFLLYGNLQALQQARTYLAQAVATETAIEDTLSRWVAALLLSLAEDLQSASIWTRLPPEVPPNVRRAFAAGQPQVLTLWPPQLELMQPVDGEGTTLLSASVKRSFISAPTSGGKTLLAQLIILTHLATTTTSVIYVAPTRSLCREIRRSLEARLRYLGKAITDDQPIGAWLDAGRQRMPDPQEQEYTATGCLTRRGVTTAIGGEHQRRYDLRYG